jgi:thiamine biosynthesis lipoprotein
VTGPAAFDAAPSEGPAGLYRFRFRAMGGGNEIAVSTSAGRDAAMAAMQDAAREVLRIERKYSRYRTDDESIVHRINRMAGQPGFTACDPETMDLLRSAAALHDLSDGLFDLTSGVLRRAWNFSKPELPSPGLIDSLLPLVGWSMVEFGDGRIRLPRAGMELDFGGIGKEYAADRAAGVLVRHGVASGYVNLGGDIRAIGLQPDGRPWIFGVRDPRNPQGVISQVSVSGGGLSTSGDYEKFIEIGGTRYCHILSPKSGFPVHCWRSVSVAGVSCLAAGAMSTIAMLKEADAVPFLERMRCHYLLVDAQGVVLTNT